MTAIAPPGAGTTVTEERSRTRTKGLAEALSALRSRRRSNVSLENVFLTVGTLCLPIGIVTIILGWYGAAHTGHLYEQNDYLISGGLLGLGLILVGAVLCTGYWMTRQIRSTESGSRQVLEALSRLDGQRGRPDAVTHAGAQFPVFVVTANGTMRHRPECPAAGGQTVRIVAGPEATGYRTCGICTDREEARWDPVVPG